VPVLKDFRETKTITLPSFADSKVEIYSSLLVADMGTIDPNNTNELKTTIEVLPMFIKSWNFTNENGEALPINIDNLGFLQLEDLKYLSEQITSFVAESKKKVSD